LFPRFALESPRMKQKILLVLLVIGFIGVAMLANRIAEEKFFLNLKLPNLYAPNYQQNVEPAYWLKSMKKDRLAVIDKVIVFKPDRARKINSFWIDSMDGGTIDSKNFKGKVTLIYVWSTISEPAKKEMLQLRKTMAKYRDSGFQAFGIAVNSPRDDVNSLIKAGGVPFSTAIVKGKAPVYFRFFPTAIYLDRKARVRVLVSYPLETSTREKILEILLNEKS